MNSSLCFIHRHETTRHTPFAWAPWSRITLVWFKKQQKKWIHLVKIDVILRLFTWVSQHYSKPTLYCRTLLPFRHRLIDWMPLGVEWQTSLARGYSRHLLQRITGSWAWPTRIRQVRRTPTRQCRLGSTWAARDMEPEGRELYGRE